MVNPLNNFGHLNRRFNFKLELYSKRIPKYQYIFKIIIVGAAGKTDRNSSLAIRSAENYFRESSRPILGVDFLSKTVIINETRTKLQLWDIGEQEFVLDLLPFYFSGAAGGVLVFDLTNRESFNSLPFWLGKMRKHAGDIPLILVGDKVHLTSQRKISSEEANTFASENGLIYLETSAKQNVKECDIFVPLTRVIQKKMARSIQEKDFVARTIQEKEIKRLPRWRRWLKKLKTILLGDFWKK